MLWGFGDDVSEANECLPETLETLEDCVMDYIETTVGVYSLLSLTCSCASYTR